MNLIRCRATTQTETEQRRNVKETRKKERKNMWAVFKSYQKSNKPIVLIQFTLKILAWQNTNTFAPRIQYFITMLCYKIQKI